ncbi:hypothetical protein BDV98DRAFT_52726 [Pterulicium gracile]|uniref:Uncharacterized protein n=1 Tax=Pterulicium gracile TaxID=1884261 RepID=A0A5C3QJN5_9AGAR|nr:hypothetical protein BDV98DRAFT_52726 [Pterula gracilis]
MPRFAAVLNEIRTQIASESTRSACLTIDDCIADASSLILDLKFLRNQRTSFSALPTEILSHILVLAVQPARLDVPRDSWEYLPLPWEEHVELTRVCRRWRAVAMGCPEYWAGVPFSSSRNYSQMLARSRSAPLRIRIDVNGSHLTRPRLSGGMPLQSDANRLAELHVRLDEARFALFMQYFPHDEAPALRSLNLACQKGFRPATIDQAAQHYQIPLHVFTCAKPRLRELRLYSCSVPWDSIQLTKSFPKNLHTLHLGHTAGPTSELLCDALKASPGLRDLRLIRSLDPRGTLYRAEKIQLGHLERCRVEDDTGPFAQFYSSISHPKSTIVSIDVGLRTSDSFPALLSACGLFSPSPEQKLELSLHKSQYSSRLTLCTLSSSQSNKFELAINLFAAPIPSILSTLHSIPSLEEVTVKISAHAQVRAAAFANPTVSRPSSHLYTPSK